MKQIYHIDNIKNIAININPGDIIFLYGDLAAGKTTLSKHIINHILGGSREVTSPTYVYYNKYDNIYHFDLYRLGDYMEFVNIGGEEILDNDKNISIIEWPELLKSYYKPDIEIYLNKLEDRNSREIEIVYKK